MPQVARDVVKERARRLRQKGEAALRAPSRLRGRRTQRRVLAESDRLGRTEQFTQVALPTPVEPGTIVDVAIIGHDGRRLVAA